MIETGGSVVVAEGQDVTSSEVSDSVEVSVARDQPSTRLRLNAKNASALAGVYQCQVKVCGEEKDYSLVRSFVVAQTR